MSNTISAAHFYVLLASTYGPIFLLMLAIHLRDMRRWAREREERKQQKLEDRIDRLERRINRLEGGEAPGPTFLRRQG